jgi:hypothetical protein
MNNFPVWMEISPIAACASDAFPITDTLNAGTTITAMSVKIYLGSTDVTAVNMTTGSESYSGNVYTTKIINVLRGGNSYILAAKITIDGVVTTRKCEIRVQKDSDIL